MEAGRAHRPFLIWPDPRLRQVAAPVGTIDDGVRALWEEMLAAMVAMPGVGLAAPQIGVPRRLCVVDATGEGRGAALRMADPVLLRASTVLEKDVEGSPNLPGVAAEVERPRSIRIAYTDAAGERVERDLDGLWARSALHQLDHLEGRLYVERLSPLKRRLLLEKWRKGRR